ncbi:GLPGLI family protein [Chryseobacterium sp. H1D6B]|uniref:GLPGLI family protein n=1 Tax=Chryseobacterium sp. H1D6B TaxID=2940588 RepID=UPI0017F82D4E|nr:GLPGLI family protein [Chryseobacterium sp. H1D6B]MDH6252135.1 GLPGLI family protein [Chryseobacterium sp. H1D6B]
MKKIAFLFVLSGFTFFNAQSVNYQNRMSVYGHGQGKMKPTIETENTIQWKIESETKEIDAYHLQKATASFGGRRLTAWFSPDIAFCEGGYKFAGLPGLVLYVEDSGKEFVYKKNLKKNGDLIIREAS